MTRRGFFARFAGLAVLLDLPPQTVVTFSVLPDVVNSWQPIEIYLNGKPVKVHPCSYRSHVDVSPELMKAFGPDDRN